MKKQRGVTLIEVLVVILIIGILSGIAGPNLLNFIRRTQSMSALNEWVSDINMARTEAIKRRTRAVICARQDDTTCGSDWTKGYLIFSDANSDGALNSGELLLKNVQNPGSTLTLGVTALATSTALSSITFRPSGGAIAAVKASVCAESGATGKSISITLAGQIITATKACP